MKQISIILLRIQKTGIIAPFCWVLTQVGLEGNEKVDMIAKSALKLKVE